MKLSLTLLFVLALLLAACVVKPSPTPPPPPISPLEQPEITPTPRPIPDGGAIFNPSFEPPYSCPENAVCVPRGWHYWRVMKPPCRPGTFGCMDCPTNCQRDKGDGVCWDDDGCYWASPEFGEIANAYYSYRVHSGDVALKIFASGRLWEAGVWQQVYHVPMRSQLTFSVWAQSWQCYEYLNCDWGHLSDKPASMNIRVGIDPLGGTDPKSSSIVWSQVGESFDVYDQFTVSAIAFNQVVTVFVIGAPRWDFARGNGNDLYIDDARLVVGPVFNPTQAIWLPVVTK